VFSYKVYVRLIAVLENLNEFDLVVSKKIELSISDNPLKVSNNN